MATIFAWSGALRKRGEKDGLDELIHFADTLEKACLDTLNSGVMTKDLTRLAENIEVTEVNSEEFLRAIRSRLETLLES
jgi:isocitrate dehydrogenase